MASGGLLSELERGSRIAAVRLRSLGDCVLTTPALALLKEARPDVEIAVVAEPRFAGVFEGNPDVAKILGPSVGELRGWKPTLCLNLHGGTRSALLTALSGARWRAGFQHFRHSFLYNVQLPRAQQVFGIERTVHTAEHLASAVFALGAPRKEIPRARLFAQGARRPGPYAVLHPFASLPAKTWPAECFLAIAQELRESRGWEPVFIGTPAEDLRAFAEYETAQGPSLEELKSLLAGATLFVGNDSGPAHMAAALGVPLVVLFADSDPVVWAPWRATAEQIVADGPIETIEVETVLRACERLKVAA